MIAETTPPSEAQVIMDTLRRIVRSLRQASTSYAMLDDLTRSKINYELAALPIEEISLVYSMRRRLRPVSFAR